MVAGAVAVGVDEGGGAVAGDGGGEEDDGYAEGAEPLEEPEGECVAVGVVGVYFVDDDGFAGQAQPAEHHVAVWEYGEGGLVPGADGDAGEEASVAAAEPFGDGAGFAGCGVEVVGGVGGVEPGHRVQERDGRRGAAVGAGVVADASPHGIGGGHGRQEESETFGAGGRSHDPFCVESRFGFALARWGGDQKEAGAGSGEAWQVLGQAFLHGVQPLAAQVREELRESAGSAPGRWAELRVAQGRGCCPPGAAGVSFPVCGAVSGPASLAGLNPGDLGCEPVGEDDQSCGDDRGGSAGGPLGWGWRSEQGVDEMDEAFALLVPCLVAQGGYGAEGAGEFVALVGECGGVGAVVSADELPDLVGGLMGGAAAQGHAVDAVQQFREGEVGCPLVAGCSGFGGGRLVAGQSGHLVCPGSAGLESGRDLPEVVEAGESDDEQSGFLLGQAPAVGDHVALSGGQVALPQSIGHDGGVDGVAAGGIGAW
nr:hypothetical protein [Streptomyces sp. WM4235]